MVLEAHQLEQARSTAISLPLDFLGLLRLEGPDVGDYLQRVTSQDAEGLGQGISAPACLLTGKGKLQAHFRLLKVREDLFFAETWRERLPELRDLLDRFIFTEKIEMNVLDDQVGMGVLGPDAPRLCGGGEPFLGKDEVREEDGVLRFRSDELEVPFCRIYGGDAVMSLERQRLLDEGLPLGHRPLFEALRIDAAQPLWGMDADDTTIPLEVGLDEACHAEKGCYTGQEIIARIRTYGHVNRKLMRIRFSSDRALEAGSLIYDDGMQAGRLTSSYLSPVDGRWHALALLPLAVIEDAEDLRVGACDGPEVELHETI
jgi:tRNA-modifying protein YgfZ